MFEIEMLPKTRNNIFRIEILLKFFFKRFTIIKTHKQFFKILHTNNAFLSNHRCNLNVIFTRDYMDDNTETSRRLL